MSFTAIQVVKIRQNMLFWGKDCYFWVAKTRSNTNVSRKYRFLTIVLGNIENFQQTLNDGNAPLQIIVNHPK